MIKLPRDTWRAARTFLVIAVPPQALWLLDRLDFAEKLGLEAVVIAFALGIPALGVAIRHAKELSEVATRLEAVAGQVSDVATSIPTRGIGVFPEYLSEVVEVIGRATTSIKILCDTPGDGAFSNARLGIAPAVTAADVAKTSHVEPPLSAPKQKAVTVRYSPKAPASPP